MTRPTRQRPVFNVESGLFDYVIEPDPAFIDTDIMIIEQQRRMKEDERRSDRIAIESIAKIRERERNSDSIALGASKHRKAKMHNHYKR